MEVQGRNENDLEHFVARRMLQIFDEFGLEDAEVSVGGSNDKDFSCFLVGEGGASFRFLDQATINDFPYQNCGDVVDVLVPFAAVAQQQANLERSLIPFTDAFSEAAASVGAYQALAETASFLHPETLWMIQRDLSFEVDVVTIEYEDWINSQVLQPRPSVDPSAATAVNQALLLDRITGAVSAIYPTGGGQLAEGFPIRAIVFSPLGNSEDVVETLLGQQNLDQTSLVVTEYVDAGWLVSNFEGPLSMASTEDFGGGQRNFISKFITERRIPTERLPQEYQWLSVIEDMGGLE